MTGTTELPWFVPASSPRKERLAFGVEIELSLASLDELVHSQDPNSDPDKGDPRKVFGINHGRNNKITYNDRDGTLLLRTARQHVADTLIGYGIAAQINPEEGNTYVELQSPRNWLIKSDAAVDEQKPDERYEYHPVELNSPPFYYSEEAIQEVKHVLTILSNTYRCYLPTSIDVHVGMGSNKFSIETIRNLLATYFVFEKHIELIYPPRRLDYNKFCPSLQRGIVFAQKIPAALDPKQEKQVAVSAIFTPIPAQDKKGEFIDPKDFIWRMTRPTYIEPRFTEVYDSARSALNIGPWGASQDSRNTVEYRQHVMTLDPKEVEMWIKLCVGLVEFADTIESEQILRAFLEKHMEDPPVLGLEEVLNLLGMPREAKYFANANGLIEDHRT